MARCFPYPSNCYDKLVGGTRGYDRSLIESIKLQKEKERAKKDRKEEKKREKKEKSREHLQSEYKDHYLKKRKHDDRRKFDHYKDSYDMKAKEEIQLEKSSLTEENGPPSSIQSLYDSDSTQDCRKKQKVADPCIPHGSLDKAPSLRIRLSVGKKDAESPRPSQISGQVTISLDSALKSSALDEKAFFSGRTDRQVPGHQLAVAVTAPVDINPDGKTSSKGSRRIRKLEKKFKDLIMDWNPISVNQFVVDDFDFDWLLCKAKQPGSAVAIAEDATSKVSSHESSSAGSLQPRACYLPQTDVHALPYVLPF